MRIMIGFLLALLIALPSRAQTMLRGTWQGVVMQLPPRQMQVVVQVSGP
jgi:thiamine phosphate synthase YjbQ (UPF0047 family)